MTAPLYNDTAIIRNVTFSSRGGHKVTFEMDPVGWEALKGRETTLCMMVLVEVGNDGQPAESAPTAPAQKPRRHMSELSRAQQAGILCGTPAFRTFLCSRFAPTWWDAATGGDGERAAQYVREYCDVESRTELSDEVAWAKFKALRTEFDAWTGKIGRPE